MINGGLILWQYAVRRIFEEIFAGCKNILNRFAQIFYIEIPEREDCSAAADVIDPFFGILIDLLSCYAGFLDLGNIHTSEERHSVAIFMHESRDIIHSLAGRPVFNARFDHVRDQLFDFSAGMDLYEDPFFFTMFADAAHGFGEQFFPGIH